MSQEQVEVLEQEQEVTEENTEAVVSDEQATEQINEGEKDDTGTNNEKVDGPKPNFTKSVGKAQDPKAKGTGAKAMSETATRMGMIKDIYDTLQEMDKEEVSSVLSALKETQEDESEEAIAEESETESVNIDELKQQYEIDVKSDVEALISGEELSEEFKEKAAVIFESAVFAKVNEEVNRRIETLEEEYRQQLDEGLNETRTEMVQKVDDYLNYVVKEWMQDNELAIEKGIRSEIVEDFMVGLKNLFVEHYIDIPDEKVDLVDDLFAKVEDLEESLNKEIEKGMTMQKDLTEYRKAEAIVSVCEDLTDVQVEKMQKLAEGVDFETDDQYAEKLQVIKENYFPAEGSVISEEAGSDDSEPEVLTEEEVKEVEAEAEMSDVMKRYSRALSRTTKK